MQRQLAFDLRVRHALGREDFFVAPPNALALAMLDMPADWPQGKLLLIGPQGAGKSHLAAVWAEAAGAMTIASDAIDGLPDAAAVVVEDADRVGGNGDREEALFHLHNHILASGGRLLLTARSDPRHWDMGLHDLASRMQATAIARIEPPDDSLLAAVIVKLFSDRQLQVPANLVPYLLSRIDRSFAAAQAMVTALDARALTLGRPITRALAAELLDNAGCGAS